MRAEISGQPARPEGSPSATAKGTATHEGAISFSCPEEVSKRIAQLYGDERLADVIFIVRQGDEGSERRFVAHRNIVSAWSRPLDRMLCGGFAEGSSREVQIRDVEPSAFEAMLKLMYCGVAEITGENVLAVLDASVRFDVAPLVQFSVQFLQNHTSSEHACRMLEVGVQYGLARLVDKCIELIVTDDHILESDDFGRLSQAAVIELARHDSWNMHEDDIYETMLRWAAANASSEEERRCLAGPILEHLRYPHMSVEKLKQLSQASEVPHHLIFEALFFLLQGSAAPEEALHLTGRFRPRPGSLLFSWVPTAKITVSGEHHETARHTSSNGFTGVRGDRRMQHGIYSWTIDIAETQSSWLFVGIAHADDTNDVAWRSTGCMMYCLDSRVFHQGSGSNHPGGDRKVCSGDCLQVVLDCTRHTLAFGVNGEKPTELFRDLAPTAYVAAVDLRDCGDKIRILSSNPHVRGVGGARPSGSPPQQPQEAPPLAAPVAAAAVAEVPALHQELGVGPQEAALLAAASTQAAPPPDWPAAAEPSAARSSAAAAAPGASAPAVPPEPTVVAGVPAAAAAVPPATRRAPAASGWEAHAAGAPHPAHAPHGGPAGGAIGSHPHAAATGNTVRTLQPRQSQGSQGGAPPAIVPSIAEQQEEESQPAPTEPAAGS